MKSQIVWRVRKPDYYTGEVKTYWWKHSTYSPTACDGSCRPLEGICNPFWWLEALIGWLRFRLWGHSNPKSCAEILRCNDTAESRSISQTVEPVLDRPEAIKDIGETRHSALGGFVSTRAVNVPLDKQNNDNSGSVPADIPQEEER